MDISEKFLSLISGTTILPSPMPFAIRRSIFVVETDSFIVFGDSVGRMLIFSFGVGGPPRQGRGAGGMGRRCTPWAECPPVTA